MYNGQTISLKTILWTVLRNKLVAGLTYEEAAEFAIEAISILGSPLVFENKVTNPALQIVNNKAAIPTDLINIRGARIINNLDNYDDGAIALRYATDLYHESTDCNNEDVCNIVEYTYTIQKGIIFTSIPSGYVQISYKGLLVDEEGYPLIPKNKKLELAIEYYILHRFLEPLWMMGKITDKAFSYVEQKRHFYMGSASNDLKLVGIDHLESTMNTINRLIINTKAHDDFYKNSGAKERLRKYS